MQKRFEIPENTLRKNAPIRRKVRHNYQNELIDEQENAAAGTAGRRDGERAFLSHITMGDMDGLKRYLAVSSTGSYSFSVGNLSDNALAQARYTLVSAVTLYTRAAIDGGLPENLAYPMSDNYIRYADRMTDPQQIHALSFHAMADFCQAVHEWHLTECGPVIRLCCDYILAHLHETISLNDLARVSGLSAHYVSDLFRRETGCAPGSYIRTLKLEQARLLLMKPDLPISQIAQMLAFPSHSSFAGHFRRQYGMTPAAYRRQPF